MYILVATVPKHEPIVGIEERQCLRNDLEGFLQPLVGDLALRSAAVPALVRPSALLLKGAAIATRQSSASRRCFHYSADE